MKFASVDSGSLLTKGGNPYAAVQTGMTNRIPERLFPDIKKQPAAMFAAGCLIESGRHDSNMRPPGPKPGALPG